MKGMEAFSRQAFIDHFKDDQGYPVQDQKGAIGTQPEGLMLGPSGGKYSCFQRNVDVYIQQAASMLKQACIKNIPREIDLAKRHAMTTQSWSFLSITTKSSAKTVQDWVRHLRETDHPVYDILDAEAEVINAVTNSLSVSAIEEAIRKLEQAFLTCTKTDPGTLAGKEELRDFLNYERSKLPLRLAKMLNPAIDVAIENATPATLRTLEDSGYAKALETLNERFFQRHQELTNAMIMDPMELAQKTFIPPETLTVEQEHIYSALGQIKQGFPPKDSSQSPLGKNWHGAIKEKIAACAKQMGNYQSGLPPEERLNDPVLKDAYIQLHYYGTKLQGLNPDGEAVDTLPRGEASAICLSRTDFSLSGGAVLQVEQQEILQPDTPDEEGFSDRQIITITKKDRAGNVIEAESKRYQVRFNEHTGDIFLYHQKGWYATKLDFTPEQLRENYVSIATMLVQGEIVSGETVPAVAEPIIANHPEIRRQYGQLEEKLDRQLRATTKDEFWRDDARTLLPVCARETGALKSTIYQKLAGDIRRISAEDWAALKTLNEKTIRLHFLNQSLHSGHDNKTGNRVMLSSQRLLLPNAQDKVTLKHFENYALGEPDDEGFLDIQSIELHQGREDIRKYVLQCKGYDTLRLQKVNANGTKTTLEAIDPGTLNTHFLFVDLLVFDHIANEEPSRPPVASTKPLLAKLQPEPLPAPVDPTPNPALESLGLSPQASSPAPSLTPLATPQSTPPTTPTPGVSPAPSPLPVTPPPLEASIETVVDPMADEPEVKSKPLNGEQNTFGPLKRHQSITNNGVVSEVMFGPRQSVQPEGLSNELDHLWYKGINPRGSSKVSKTLKNIIFDNSRSRHVSQFFYDFQHHCQNGEWQQAYDLSDQWATELAEEEKDEQGKITAVAIKLNGAIQDELARLYPGDIHDRLEVLHRKISNIRSQVRKLIHMAKEEQLDPSQFKCTFVRPTILLPSNTCVSAIDIFEYLSDGAAIIRREAESNSPKLICLDEFEPNDFVADLYLRSAQPFVSKVVLSKGVNGFDQSTTLQSNYQDEIPLNARIRDIPLHFGINAPIYDHRVRKFGEDGVNRELGILCQDLGWPAMTAKQLDEDVKILCEALRAGQRPEKLGQVTVTIEKLLLRANAYKEFYAPDYFKFLQSMLNHYQNEGFNIASRQPEEDTVHMPMAQEKPLGVQHKKALEVPGAVTARPGMPSVHPLWRAVKPELPTDAVSVQNNPLNDKWYRLFRHGSGNIRKELGRLVQNNYGKSAQINRVNEFLAMLSQGQWQNALELCEQGSQDPRGATENWKLISKNLSNLLQMAESRQTDLSAYGVLLVPPVVMYARPRASMVSDITSYISNPESQNLHSGIDMETKVIHLSNLSPDTTLAEFHIDQPIPLYDRCYFYDVEKDNKFRDRIMAELPLSTPLTDIPKSCNIVWAEPAGCSNMTRVSKESINRSLSRLSLLDADSLDKQTKDACKQLRLGQGTSEIEQLEKTLSDLSYKAFKASEQPQPFSGVHDTLEAPYEKLSSYIQFLINILNYYKQQSGQ